MPYGYHKPRQLHKAQAKWQIWGADILVTHDKQIKILNCIVDGLHLSTWPLFFEVEITKEAMKYLRTWPLADQFKVAKWHKKEFLD